MSVIEATDTVHEVQVMSSDHYYVKKVKDLNSNVMTSMICHCKLYNAAKYAKEIGADVINTSWKFLSKDIVDQVHQAGMLVCGGLNNDPDLWVMMQDWGVDMVDTAHRTFSRKLRNSAARTKMVRRRGSGAAQLLCCFVVFIGSLRVQK